MIQFPSQNFFFILSMHDLFHPTPLSAAFEGMEEFQGRPEVLIPRLLQALPQLVNENIRYVFSGGVARFLHVGGNIPRDVDIISFIPGISTALQDACPGAYDTKPYQQLSDYHIGLQPPDDPEVFIRNCSILTQSQWSDSPLVVVSPEFLALSKLLPWSLAQRPPRRKDQLDIIRLLPILDEAKFRELLQLVELKDAELAEEVVGKIAQLKENSAETTADIGLLISLFDRARGYKDEGNTLFFRFSL